MFQKLKKLICRHTYGWSERRQVEVCYNCGQVREESEAGLAAAIPTDG